MRHLGLAKLELTIAPFSDFNGSSYSLNLVGEKRLHLVRRFQVKLVALETEAVFLLNRLCTRVYCEQNILSLPIFGSDIVDIVGHDERNAEFLAHCNEGFVNPFLFGYAVILKFKEEVVRSENLSELTSQLFSRCDVIPQNCTTNGACKASACSDQTLVIFSQQFLVGTRLVVKAFKVSLADDFDEVVVSDLVLAQEQEVMSLSVLARTSVISALRRVVDFSTEYRFNACFGASLIKLNDAIHDTVIREGYSGHLKFARSLDQILNSPCPVQEAVFGVNMQMHELSHHLHRLRKKKRDLKESQSQL